MAHEKVWENSLDININLLWLFLHLGMFVEN